MNRCLIGLSLRLKKTLRFLLLFRQRYRLWFSSNCFLSMLMVASTLAWWPLKRLLFKSLSRTLSFCCSQERWTKARHIDRRVGGVMCMVFGYPATCVSPPCSVSLQVNPPSSVSLPSFLHVFFQLFSQGAVVSRPLRGYPADWFPLWNYHISNVVVSLIAEYAWLYYSDTDDIFSAWTSQ